MIPRGNGSRYRWATRSTRTPPGRISREKGRPARNRGRRNTRYAFFQGSAIGARGGWFGGRPTVGTKCGENATSRP